MRRQLYANEALQQHVAIMAKSDVAFFLSHRNYLARGLSVRQRAACALHHYRHEVRAFDRGYFDAVYHGRGLLLWHAETESGVFDIRLIPGVDVMYEGGASVVAHFDGQRICVISYSTVNANDLLPKGTPPPAHGSTADATTLFVTRKHLATDHSYQVAFNKAFDRCTPGHFCFAALTGIAMAQGFRKLLAIAPSLHPSYKPALERHLHVAYTQFWESLAGRADSPFGYTIDLPMRLTPLDGMNAKTRKRAIARRRHIDEVVDSAHDAIRRHLSAALPTMAAAHDAIASSAGIRARAKRDPVLRFARALVSCMLMAVA